MPCDMQEQTLLVVAEVQKECDTQEQTSLDPADVQRCCVMQTLGLTFQASMPKLP